MILPSMPDWAITKSLVEKDENHTILDNLWKHNVGHEQLK